MRCCKVRTRKEKPYTCNSCCIEVYIGATTKLLLGMDVLPSFGFSLQAKDANGSKSCPIAFDTGCQTDSPTQESDESSVIPSVLLPFELGDHLLECYGLQAAEAAVTGSPSF